MINIGYCLDICDFYPLLEHCSESEMCLKYDYPSLQLNFICMDGLSEHILGAGLHRPSKRLTNYRSVSHL